MRAIIMDKVYHESYNCLDDFNTSIQRRKDLIKSNLEKSFNTVEKHFNMRLIRDIIEKDSSIVIQGKNQYQFTVSKWFDSKINSENHLEFDCLDFPLPVPNIHSSTFSISLNNDFSIAKSEYSLTFKGKNRERFSVKLKFDESFNIIEMNNQSVAFHLEDYGIRKTLKTKEQLCPFEDEIILFKLSINNDKDIKELIPEYYIPSVYNFHSAEFKERLNLFSMFCF